MYFTYDDNSLSDQHQTRVLFHQVFLCFLFLFRQRLFTHLGQRLMFFLKGGGGGIHLGLGLLDVVDLVMLPLLIPRDLPISVPHQIVAILQRLQSVIADHDPVPEHPLVQSPVVVLIVDIILELPGSVIHPLLDDLGVAPGALPPPDHVGAPHLHLVRAAAPIRALLGGVFR